MSSSDIMLGSLSIAQLQVLRTARRKSLHELEARRAPEVAVTMQQVIVDALVNEIVRRHPAGEPG